MTNTQPGICPFPSTSRSRSPDVCARGWPTPGGRTARRRLEPRRPIGCLKELAECWRTGYGSRACEAELHKHPQFIPAVDGHRIKFLRVRSSEPDVTPVLVHGWPGERSPGRTAAPAPRGCTRCRPAHGRASSAMEDEGEPLADRGGTGVPVPLSGLSSNCGRHGVE
ncbi:MULTISPECIES: epoxide hydrolase N-terminal domain-containing protein [Amycolatopsis]|uniref:epoxide hydrolase N-terminal domain-containing protein n=1 Tax=Amycolatopsis TaxID=1813 RepID=UPI0033B62167